MICGIGSDDGFFPNASLVFHAKTPVEGLPDDYHKSMNAEVFENWIFNLVETGKIPSHSVIIMDYAPFHNRKEFLQPNKSWKKSVFEDEINHCNSQRNGWTRKTKQIEEEEALRMELDQYLTNVISE